MFVYLLSVLLLWSAALIFYALLLRRETFWQLNRFMLLFVLAAGVLFPLLDLPAAPTFNATYLQPVLIGMERGAETARQWSQKAAGFDWMWVFPGLYGLGLALSLLRIFSAFRQIKHWLKTARLSPKEGFVLAESPLIEQPFSFGRWIFLKEDPGCSPTEKQWILEHEREHLRQRHSLDLLFLELLTAFFWFFAPLLKYYRIFLTEIHEYQADAATLRFANKKQYGRMLLRHSCPDKPVPLMHAFFSNLQNRFTMMFKPKSPKTALFKYAFFVPLFALLGFVLRPNSLQAQKQDEKTVFKIVDVMPRFPGCEDLSDRQERDQCAMQNMLNFIYSNIRYPKAAMEKKIQGTVVVSFIVEKDGSITEPKVVRSIGGGCDEEVLRIVQMMPDWIPGEQDGQKVRVHFNLPVKFKMEDEKKE